MKLKLLDLCFSIVKLAPTQPIPESVTTQEWYNVTRTPDELSIVCPTSALENINIREAEHGWRCFQVEGVLDFGLTGILFALTKPLAERQISVFAVSTYNTDYLLVKEDKLTESLDALELAGFELALRPGSSSL